MTTTTAFMSNNYKRRNNAIWPKQSCRCSSTFWYILILYIHQLLQLSVFLTVTSPYTVVYSEIRHENGPYITAYGRMRAKLFDQGISSGFKLNKIQIFILSTQRKTLAHSRRFTRLSAT